MIPGELRREGFLEEADNQWENKSGLRAQTAGAQTRLEGKQGTQSPWRGLGQGHWLRVQRQSRTRRELGAIKKEHQVITAVPCGPELSSPSRPGIPAGANPSLWTRDYCHFTTNTSPGHMRTEVRARHRPALRKLTGCWGSQGNGDRTGSRCKARGVWRWEEPILLCPP